MCAVQCIFFTSDAPLGLWMLSFGRAPTRAARLARIRKTFDWPGCFSESLSLGCHTQPVSTIWTKEYYDVLQDVLWNFMESHGLHGITWNCMELHGIMCLYIIYVNCMAMGSSGMSGESQTSPLSFRERFRLRMKRVRTLLSGGRIHSLFCNW
jgi:hypothetical protein